MSEIDLELFDRVIAIHSEFEQIYLNETRILKSIIRILIQNDNLEKEVILFHLKRYYEIYPNENITERFINEIDSQEVKCFYGFQEAMENIHSETYSLLIDKFGGDKKNDLFNAIDCHPATKAKAGPNIPAAKNTE